MKNGRPQAKDVPEEEILRVLRDAVGVWHTHFSGFGHMPSLIEKSPALSAFPEKVLRTKLGKMARRKLINGCDCGCRGDWHVPFVVSKPRLSIAIEYYQCCCGIYLDRNRQPVEPIEASPVVKTVGILCCAMCTDTPYDVIKNALPGETAGETRRRVGYHPKSRRGRRDAYNWAYVWSKALRMRKDGKCEWPLAECERAKSEENVRTLRW